jgi:hypothetical protein
MVDAMMPALFVGHGSPMNAIEDNEFSRAWQVAGRHSGHCDGEPAHDSRFLWLPPSTV